MYHSLCFWLLNFGVCEQSWYFYLEIIIFSLKEVADFFTMFSLDRLLDRDQIENEEASLDDEEDDSFLKAFKVLCSVIVFFFLFSVSFSVLLIHCWSWCEAWVKT